MAEITEKRLYGAVLREDPARKLVDLEADSRVRLPHRLRDRDIVREQEYVHVTDIFEADELIVGGSDSACVNAKLRVTGGISGTTVLGIGVCPPAATAGRAWFSDSITVGGAFTSTEPARLRGNTGSPVALEALLADASAYAAFRASTVYATVAAVIGTDPTGSEQIRASSMHLLNGLTAIRLARGQAANAYTMKKTNFFQIVGDDSTNGQQLNRGPSISLLAPEAGASVNQDQSSATIELSSSRSTIAQLNAGVFTATVTGDSLGDIRFGGDTTVNLRSAGARIRAVAAATWSATSNPADLYFATVPIGSTGLPVDRWVIQSSGHFISAPDNTLDIGLNGGNRPRTGYFGTSVITPAVLTSGATDLLLGTNLTARWVVANDNVFAANIDNTNDIGRNGANRPRTIYAGTGIISANGAANIPAYSFASETDMGFYRHTAGGIGITIGGSRRYEFINGSFSPQTAGAHTLGLIGQRWGKFWGQDADFSLDVKMDVLGTFDHTGTRFSTGTGPVADDLMSYHGSAGKWRPRFLQTAFTSGVAVSQNNLDNTFATFFNSGPALSGAPTNPGSAPILTPIYKGMIIDMSAYVLSGTQVYVLDYSTNGGVYTSGKIITTSAKVVHSSLDPTKTYAYKFLVRGGSDSAYSPATAATNPSSVTEANGFGLIVASQIATVFLSAINANIGSITAGQLISGDGKSILQLDSTFSVPSAVTQGIFFASANPVPGTVTGMYLDFTATTTNPILHHAKIDLRADGTATFKGLVDITNAPLSLGLGGAFLVLRDSDVAHGMTNAVPTDVLGVIIAGDALAGGMDLAGFADNTVTAMRIEGYNVGAHISTSVMTFTVGKKSGSGVAALAATDAAFELDNFGTSLIRMFGDGLVLVDQQSTSGIQIIQLSSSGRDVLNIGQASVGGSDTFSSILINSTWNTTGAPTLIKANVTNTASGAAALLLDLQVGGTSKFKIEKDGTLIIKTIKLWDQVTSGNPFLNLSWKNSGGVSRDGYFEGTGDNWRIYSTTLGGSIMNWNFTNGQVVFNAAVGFDAYAGSFRRSAGGSTVPDLYGDGTNALVIGGKSDGTGTVQFGTTTLVRMRHDDNVLTLTNVSGGSSNTHIRWETSAGTRNAFISKNQGGSFSIYNDENQLLEFGTNATARWQISAAGHFIAATDQTFDIGALNATRPRDIYASGNGLFGGSLTAGGGLKSTGGQTLVSNTQSAPYGAPTGTATRTTFATGTVTLIVLAEHVKALIDDLKSGHGLLG